MSISSPAFLVIGAARSGTTYLSRALDAHPELAMARTKEPNFLAMGIGEHSFSGPGDGWTAKSLIRNEAAWRRLFEPRNGLRIGEASVTTMYYPDISIARIREMCPDTQLVAVLRAPWERSRSAWMLLSGQGRETLAFADALDAESSRIRSGYESIWHYRAQSMYARQIRPFLEAFGERLLVVEYERMVTGTSEIQRIFAHLGVRSHPVPDLGRVNAASDSRFARIRLRMDAAHERPFLRSAARAAIPSSVRRSVLHRLSVSAIATPFPPGFVESFDDDLAELRSILGDRAPPGPKLDKADQGVPSASSSDATCSSKRVAVKRSAFRLMAIGSN